MNFLLFITIPFLELVNAPTPNIPIKPESAVVEGRIIDSASREAISFAYVVLEAEFNEKRSYAILSDSSGSFAFSGVKQGKYKLQVTMVGYKSLLLSNIEVAENASLNLNSILMSPSSTELKETKIVAEKPFIKNEVGKMIIDVERSELNQSGTALEVLQNTPTVSVNQSGDVSVKGRFGVRILLDGKPSPAAQSDPESFLRSVPAASISQVEVIHNPGAKYDAEGSSAIINIKLKKNLKRGFNAKAMATVGTVFNKFSGGLDVNFRNKKINAFVGYNVVDMVMQNKWEEERTVIENGKISLIHNINKGRDHRSGHNVKAGLDWYMKPEHTLSYTLTVNPGQGGGPWKTENSLSDAAGNLQRISKSDANYFRKKISFTNALSYQFLQDSGNVKWTADILHTHLYSDGFNNVTYRNYDTLGDFILGSDGGMDNTVKTRIDNISVMTDAEYKLGESGTFSFGLKNETNLNSYDNRVIRNQAGVSYVDSTNNYLFRYNENILAAYLTYANEIRFFHYKIGCRAEHTYVSSPLADVNQKYISFFPEISLSFDMPKQQTFSLSYGKRIGRPNFQQLNNYAVPFDQYTSEVGNPFLRPQFTNTVSAEYAKQFKKHSLYATLSFSHTTALMEQVSLLSGEKYMVMKWINAGTQSNINLDGGGNFQLLKWWSLSANFGFRQIFYNTFVADTFVHKNAPVGDFWVSTNFKLPWKLQLQLQGNMNTGYPNPQGYSLTSGQLHVTLKRSFLKETLTIALSCRDVTNTDFWKGESVAPTFRSKGFWKPESRIGYLSITYTFGEKINAPARKNIENERLNGGGGRG